MILEKILEIKRAEVSALKKNQAFDISALSGLSPARDFRGALKDKGCAIIAEVKRLTGRRLKPSTIYPILYWLEAEGYVVGKWVKKGKRSLRRYSLTSEGKTLLGKVSTLLNKPVRRVFDDLLSEQKLDIRPNLGGL